MPEALYPRALVHLTFPICTSSRPFLTAITLCINKYVHICTRTLFCHEQIMWKSKHVTELCQMGFFICVDCWFLLTECDNIVEHQEFNRVLSHHFELTFLSTPFFNCTIWQSDRWLCGFDLKLLKKKQKKHKIGTNWPSHCPLAWEVQKGLKSLWAWLSTRQAFLGLRWNTQRNQNPI